jgi:hypothetical protein
VSRIAATQQTATSTDEAAARPDVDGVWRIASTDERTSLTRRARETTLDP